MLAAAPPFAHYALRSPVSTRIARALLPLHNTSQARIDRPVVPARPGEVAGVIEERVVLMLLARAAASDSLDPLPGVAPPAHRVHDKIGVHDLARSRLDADDVRRALDRRRAGQNQRHHQRGE